jgi:hypothetical protein
MKNIIIVLVIIAAYMHFKKPENQFFTSNTPKPEYLASTSNYSCDGREYCSQMTSCAEATFFLNNCPNVKMDGNHDGVPCEKQWCN